MAHNQININFPSKVFKPSQIAFLLTFFLSVCNANSSHSSTNSADERYSNHIQYQKQKTPKNDHRHSSYHSEEIKKRNRRNEGSFQHLDSDQTHFDSIDRFYDLSHAYFDGMPVEEGGIPLEFSLTKQDEGEGARSEFYDFCMGEKLGTHINAPSTYQHYRNGSWSVDQIPINFLVNVPTIIIDHPTYSASRHHYGSNNPMFAGREKILNDGFFTNIDNSRAYIVSKMDLDEWEKKHGRIPNGALVILRTGWSQYFKQPDNFFGNFADSDDQVFPGFGEDSVSWLIKERNIRGIGTECVDIELPWKTVNAVKQLIAARNRYSLVQLTNLEKLPHKGILTTVAPMKLLGGAGGPTRVFANVKSFHKRNKHKHKPKNHQKHHQRKERNDGSEVRIDAPEEKHERNPEHLSTHTTRDIKHHDNGEEMDPDVFSTASISSRSQSENNAILSMNRAYDTGDSMASSQKSNIIILITTTFITISHLFC